jgi:NAD(P)-dependent dehydrogenase (short-subunit alcohol dehydrogenase family)
MKTPLNGHVVAITGGGRGIGLAIAKACAARGAKVALGDVDAALAEQAAAALNGYGGALDVRDRESFRAFLGTSEDRLGSVDVLINNAGIMPMGPFDLESDALSDVQIDINLRGVIIGCKLAVPLMRKNGGGHIVNVASLAGVFPLPGAAVYCATKFAVRGLTHSLREEFRDSGIAFSAVLPSRITTELAAGTDKAGRGVPSASPEDVAAAVIDALEHGLPEVTVPRYLRSAPALLALVPHQAERLLRRMIGDRRMLDDLDLAARKGYDGRLARLARVAD